MNVSTLPVEQNQKYTAIITVDCTLPPTGTSKSGKVRATDGQMFSVYEDRRSQLIPGMSYEIEFKNNKFRDITRIKPAQAVAVPEVARTQAPQQQTNGRKMDQQFYRPTSPEDKKSMFRCACVTAFIRAGQLRADRNEIANAVAEIDAGYDIAMAAEGDAPLTSG